MHFREESNTCQQVYSCCSCIPDIVSRCEPILLYVEQIQYEDVSLFCCMQNRYRVRKLNDHRKFNDHFGIIMKTYAAYTFPEREQYGVLASRYTPAAAVYQIQYEDVSLFCCMYVLVVYTRCTSHKDIHAYRPPRESLTRNLGDDEQIWSGYTEVSVEHIPSQVRNLACTLSRPLFSVFFFYWPVL